MPTLKITNDEALRVLSGEEVEFNLSYLTDDGTGSVLTVRLFTVDEYLHAFGEDIAAATNLTAPLYRFMEPGE